LTTSLDIILMCSYISNLFHSTWFINQSKDQRIKGSKNQRIKESKNQRIKESKNQRIKESTDQWINESHNQPYRPPQLKLTHEQSHQPTDQVNLNYYSNPHITSHHNHHCVVPSEPLISRSTYMHIDILVASLFAN
jgi:hypothetical protein